MERLNRKGGLVLFGATGLSFVSGILYIWSIVSKALIKEYGWSSSQAMLPYTVATIVFAFSMVFAGRLQDRRGPRLCGTLGGFLLGAGLISSGFVKQPFSMVLTFGVVLGCGIGINNVAATPPAVKWFPPEKKGLISGIVVAGIGLASVFYSPMITFLTGRFGISKSLWILGSGALCLSMLFAQFLSNPPASSGREDLSLKPGAGNPQSKGKGGYSATGGLPAVGDIAPRLMLKTGNFYKLWLMLAFASSAGLMIIGHIATIAQKQAGWEGGYLLVVLLAVFNTLGRLLGGGISDRIGRLNLMRISFFFLALVLAAFRWLATPATLALGAAAAGLCYGSTFAVFPAASADFFGLANFGANYGILFTAWGFGGVLGPLAAGKIFDLTGSYRIAYIVSLVLLILAGVLTFTVKAPARAFIKRGRRLGAE